MSRPHCPRCLSARVFRSRSGDSLILRLTFRICVRCHDCSHRFNAAWHPADASELEPPRTSKLRRTA